MDKKEMALEIGNNIKNRRLELGLTQEELAKKCGYAYRASINKVELGLVRIPSDKLALIAKALKCSPSELIGVPDNIIPISEIGEVYKMPVIGTITAGYTGLAQEEYIEDIPVLAMALHHYDPKECFVLRINGDSMYPDYRNGDRVVIHRQQSVDSGEVAVVLYNGFEATLKQVRYRQGEDWLELVPRNPEYQTKRIEGADLQECHILGKAISLVYRDVR